MIEFGPFTVDRAGGVVLRDGRDVHVPPKAMDVLLCLLERPGAVVSKEDLMGRVWAGITVTDASLTETVRTLRNALGDDPRMPTYVQTVHRRGYRFIAAIRPDGDKIPNAGVWGVSLLGSEGGPPPAAAAGAGQTAQLFVGVVLPSTTVFRYEVVTVMMGVLWLRLAACQGPQNLSTFAVSPAPADISELEWIELATDARGDGKRADYADGRSFAYYYDAIEDTLWFRLELYGAVDSELPAVSISVDIDEDQTTGISWYGANSSFTFDKMLSVGPLEPDGELVRGYNGITNADGVSRMEWINERSSVLTFFVDGPARAYIVGCARTDISPDLRRFNVIGSVGTNAQWNDDIGERGYATIDLDAAVGS